jgi:hypothetical protein
MRSIILLILGFIAAGCTQIRDEWELANGVDPILASTDLSARVKSQYAVVDNIAASAGMPGPHADYYEVVLAGFNSIDDVCVRYLTAVYRINRNKDTAIGLLGIAQTATATTMLATGAEAKAIALMAQAFGVATSSTTILANSRLYEVSPRTVFELQQKLARKYRDVLSAPTTPLPRVANAARAYKILSEYLQLCLPLRLEIEIEGIMKGAEAQAGGINVTFQ